MNKTATVIDQLSNLHRISGSYEPGKVSSVSIEVRLSNQTATSIPVAEPTREGMISAALDVSEALPSSEKWTLGDVIKRFCELVPDAQKAKFVDEVRETLPAFLAENAA